MDFKLKKTTSQTVLLCIFMLSSINNCDRVGITPGPLTSSQTSDDIGQPIDNNFKTKGLLSIYLDEGIPETILPDLTGYEWINRGNDRELASLVIHEASRAREGDYIYQSAMQVYALVAPFPTLLDDVSSGELKGFWKGENLAVFKNLILKEETLNAFAGVWGPPKNGSVRVLDPEESLDTWPDESTWALIPFNELTSRWKVISIGGISPLDPAETLLDYPLAFVYELSGNPSSESAYLEHAMELQLGKGNRELAKMTRVVMTGVTALVRATADKMETNGVTYPGQDIRYWLRSADITHISNEVAFIEGCPAPDPYAASLRFCSDPKYIGLLEDVGTDVVEMTGNHMNDWYDEGPAMSLTLYQARGWQDFGGGIDLLDSRQPALFDIHGNKVAFIGCNDPGPDFALSTETRGGSAGCEDYAWMIATIQELKLNGYQVVATVQYHENYSYLADNPMRTLFRALADAGAVVVQGSQAHTPKEMEFYGGGFIHYGLGNLFFDQMHYTLNGQNVDATRQEFIDRYIFYDNHLISIELLTAMLEDYAKPRPMTQDERRELLEAVFSVSIWD
jgi:hypothetical protein